MEVPFWFRRPNSKQIVDLVPSLHGAPHPLVWIFSPVTIKKSTIWHVWCFGKWGFFSPILCVLFFLGLAGKIPQVYLQTKKNVHWLICKCFSFNTTPPFNPDLQATSVHVFSVTAQCQQKFNLPIWRLAVNLDSVEELLHHVYCLPQGYCPYLTLFKWTCLQYHFYLIFGVCLVFKACVYVVVQSPARLKTLTFSWFVGRLKNVWHWYFSFCSRLLMSVALLPRSWCYCGFLTLKQ